MDRRTMVVLMGVLLVAAGTVYYVTSPTTGVLVVQVRDAPGTFTSLYVSFTGISVRAAGAGAGDWQTVALSRGAVDLVALRNVTAAVGQARLPAGAYAAVRIVIGQASGVLSSGTSTNVLVSNGDLVATVAFSISPGGLTTLTLDFDLAASLAQSGGAWLFTPHLGSVTVG